MACCSCRETTGDRIVCCGPNRHAICRECFPVYLSARGVGPFPDLTIAEATMLRCPMDRTDDCRLLPPCVDPWARSFFNADDVVQRGFMTLGQLEKLRETSRRTQLLSQDDGLKLETMERLMPILREYKAMCSSLPVLWEENAPEKIGEAEKAVRRLHSTLCRTPMNALGGSSAPPQGPPPRIVRCLACPSGLYYVPGGTCLVCECRHCCECGKVVGTSESHLCEEHDALTFAEVVRTTQTCPSCRALVHRTGGCDQMFCTQCNTPFSYRTGERITESVIHNPHFITLPEATRLRIQESMMASGGCNAGDIETSLALKGAPDTVMRAWWFLGHVRDTLPDDRNSVEHYDFELANRLQRLSAITGERIAPPPAKGKQQSVPKAYTDAERVSHLLLTHTKHRRRSELLSIHAEFEGIAGDLFAQLTLSQTTEEDSNVFSMIESVWNTLVEKSAAYGDFKNSVGKWLSASKTLIPP